jgi:hypothetical protein
MDMTGMTSNAGPEKFTALFLKSGTMDAGRTTFDTNSPYTYLYIRTRNSSHSNKYLIKTKWYQEKIEILDVTKEL